MELDPSWLRDKLHGMIVHAALATRHRLPPEVIPDYPGIVRSLSETIGTYLGEKPDMLL